MAADESGLPPAQLDQEELREHIALTAVFKQMKFTETEANLLASADVAPSDAQKLLSRGCSHQYAVRILI